jgi:hypothetical protein
MEFPPFFSRVQSGDLIHNFPLISLIAANIVTIVLAILGNWDLATVMFIYWAQSIIIGFFTVIFLLSAGTAALEADLSKPILERGGTRVSTRYVHFYKLLLAGFFCLHYGLFHWAYYSFIVDSGIFGSVNFSDPGIWFSCGLFFANHLYSFLAFRNTGPKGAMYVSEQFFAPYRRIIPMHLTIIFGSIIVLVLQVFGIASTLPVLILFLLLKTITDITSHIDKHNREEHPDEPVRYL